MRIKMPTTWPLERTHHTYPIKSYVDKVSNRLPYIRVSRFCSLAGGAYRNTAMTQIEGSSGTVTCSTHNKSTYTCRYY